MRLLALAVVIAGATAVAVGACGGFATDDPQLPDGGVIVSLDSGPAFCDAHAAFLRVDRLSSISTTALLDGRPSVTADERSIFFQRGNLLSSASRAQLANDFGAPTELAELRPFADQLQLESPAVNGDASVLVFGAKDGGDVNLWLTRRVPSANLFEATATELVALNTGSIERGAAFSADGTRLYFSSNRLGPFGEGEGQDSIFVSTILGDNTFSAPFALKDATTSSGLLIGYNPTPSADGKYLYFARRVPGVGDHVYIGELTADGSVNGVQAIRGTIGGTFSVPESNEYPGFISPDHCRLYFSSDALGDPDLYVASRRGR